MESDEIFSCSERKLLVAVGKAVLDSVAFLRTFCVVEAVYGAYQITGDAADTLKFNAFAHGSFVLCCLFIHIDYLLKDSMWISQCLQNAAYWDISFSGL